MTSPSAPWAAVVYGRTEAADSWWQAAPPGADTDGWLARFVYAAFDGGRQLDGGPRFLVAQDSRHRIVGVACQARELDEQRCTDGQRELPCFVGWVADRPAPGGSPGPTLEDLREQYARWAAPVYQAVMTPVWVLPHSPFRQPTVTVPAAPPWAGYDGAVEYDFSEPVPYPGEGLWPASAWTTLWAAILTSAVPFTCVVGWPQANSARRDGVTHVGAADAPERDEPLAPPCLIRVPTAKLSEPAEPAPGPAVAAEPEPAPAGSPTWLARIPGARRAVAWCLILAARLRALAIRKAPAPLLTLSRRARIGLGAAVALGMILVVLIVVIVS
jgi:hypothetical protein